MIRKRTSPVWTLSHEEFQQLLNKSKNVCHLLEGLNLRPRSGNHRTVLNRLKLEKFNTDIFERNKRQDVLNRLKILRDSTKIPLEEILVENSTFTNNTDLKKKLFEARVLKNICYECGQLPEWNEKPLVLQLDHINGINNDNRKQNLQILCPNCHTQTVTYAGKRLKQTKIRETNEEKIVRRYKQRKVKERPSREFLQNQVKLLGYCATGRAYGISDNTIRKWLK